MVFGPPVEMPIATAGKEGSFEGLGGAIVDGLTSRSFGLSVMGLRRGKASGSFRLSTAPLRVLLASLLAVPLLAAAFILDMSSLATLDISMVTVPPGLATTSKAPISRASIVMGAPSWVREETMTTGAMASSTKVLRAVSPSILGMFISRVMTSGLSSLAFSMTSLPSLAVPATSSLGSDSMMDLSVRLISAESSHTRTLIFAMDCILPPFIP